MAYVLHTSRKMYGVRPGTQLSFPASNYGYGRDSKLQNDVLHDVIPIIFDVHLRDCFLSYFISYKNKMAKRTLRTTDEINEYLDDLHQILTLISLMMIVMKIQLMLKYFLVVVL